MWRCWCRDFPVSSEPERCFQRERERELDTVDTQQESTRWSSDSRDWVRSTTWIWLRHRCCHCLGFDGLFMPSLVVWNTPYFLPRFPTFQPPVSSRRAVNISISTISGPSKFTQKMYLANSSESWKKGYLKISSKSGFSNSPRVWASITKLHDLCIRNHSHFFKWLFDGPSPLFPSIHLWIIWINSPSISYSWTFHLYLGQASEPTIFRQAKLGPVQSMRGRSQPLGSGSSLWKPHFVIIGIPHFPHNLRQKWPVWRGFFLLVPPWAEAEEWIFGPIFLVELLIKLAPALEFAGNWAGSWAGHALRVAFRGC